MLSPRFRVAMKLNGLPTHGKIVKAQSILDSMQSSINFPAAGMPIPYPGIQTTIDNFQNAVVAAENGTTADTSFMHEQERLLVGAFNYLKAHVEMVANNSADPATVIISAGMQVAVAGGLSGVSDLTLDAMGNGTVQIRVPRLQDEKAFVFETSADGITWAEATSSSLTKTSIKNLTPGSTLYVRYCAIGKAGKGTVSQSKTVIVN